MSYSLAGRALARSQGKQASRLPGGCWPCVGKGRRPCLPGGPTRFGWPAVPRLDLVLLGPQEQQGVLSRCSP